MSRVVEFRAAFVSGLVAQLAADSVSGVKVRAHEPMLSDATRDETVWLNDVSTDYEHFMFGGSQQETFRYDGKVYVPRSGADQREATEAAERAELIWESVLNLLRDDSDLGDVFHVRPESVRGHAEPDDRGVCWHLDFVLLVEAHI